MVRRLSLRARLVLGVILLAAVGLVAADVATYSSLRSFLVDQTDAQLDDAHRAVEFAVEDRRPGEQGEGRPRGPVGGAVRGYCAQVRREGIVLTGGCSTQFSGAAALSPPSYPDEVRLPASASQGGDHVRYLTVDARNGSDQYRVRAWSDDGAPGTLFFLAAPLKT